MSYRHLLYHAADGVATLTLNRPERLNALTPALVDEAIEALGRVEADPDVRVLVLTGAGRGFCSGADLAGGQAERSPSAWAASLGPVGGYGRLILALHQCSRPTIAAVNGPCVGAGLGLALACDLRLASDRATFSAIFVRRGLMPDSGTTYFLPRLVGPDHALRLLLTGETVDAAEARAIGLVTEVVPHDELAARAGALAAAIAGGAYLAARNARQAVRRALAQDLATQLQTEADLAAQCFQSADAQEGLRAFLEKREPRFTGR